jgi:hypothetical protein
MLQRCNNPKNKRFKDYGGRGIRVCKRWHSFANFFADMGPRPEGYSIERADVNGNYKRDNCAWIPRAEQAKNRRTFKRGRKSPATPPGKLPPHSTPTEC